MVSQVGRLGAHLHNMLDESFAFRQEEISRSLQSSHATTILSYRLTLDQSESSILDPGF